jgi:dTDP-4-dehydrorhamnose reductase
MRILILGGSGMLGSQVSRRLQQRHDVWVTLRQSLANYSTDCFNNVEPICGIDVVKEEDLIRAFNTARPEAVINCVGIIKQLKEAHDPVRSLTVNALLPHRLAALAAVAQARVIHMSTDCVFNGRKGNYSESDGSDAEDLYGRTKFLGELDYQHTFTIRSSIIGHELKTKSGLIDWFLSQDGKVVKGFKRAIYTGLSTIEMARVIEMLLTEHSELNGVWHVSSEPISKFDLLEIVKQVYDWSGEILPDESFLCDRSLDSTRFRAATQYRPPSWKQMIEEMAAQRAERGEPINSAAPQAS